MVPSRVVRIAGLVVGAAALVFALVPFRTGITLYDVAGAYPTVARQCGPPVAEVVRTPPKDAGWFGYAPLTSVPVANVPGACHEAAKGRIVLSAVGMFVAALLGWFSVRIGGDGDARRYRWRPEPA